MIKLHQGEIQPQHVVINGIELDQIDTEVYLEGTRRDDPTEWLENTREKKIELYQIGSICRELNLSI